MSSEPMSEYTKEAERLFPGAVQAIRAAAELRGEQRGRAGALREAAYAASVASLNSGVDPAKNVVVDAVARLYVPPPDRAAIKPYSPFIDQDEREAIECEARQALAREITEWIKQEQVWWERTAGMETRHNPQGDLLAWRNSLSSLAGRLAAAVNPYQPTSEASESESAPPSDAAGEEP